MPKARDADYTVTYLLPRAVDDYVGPDHSIRFVRSFVDDLNLSELGVKVEENRYGRPPYSSRLLIGIWLYGCMNDVLSTRKLAKACEEYLPLRWFCGELTPDHTVLSRFWKSNFPLMLGLFAESVRVAAKLGMVSMVINAIDGTKIQAAGSTRRAMKREKVEEKLKQLDTRIETIRSEVEELERNESELPPDRLPAELKTPGALAAAIAQALRELRRESTPPPPSTPLEEANRKRERLEEKRRQLAEDLKVLPQSGEAISAVEPEARIMKSYGDTFLGYNAQMVVDAKHGIVIAGDVVTDQNDIRQLVPMLDQVQHLMGTVALETIGDGGYNSAEQLALAEQKEYPVLLSPSPSDPERHPDDPYHPSKFTFNAERNEVTCPTGETLQFKGPLQRKGKALVHLYQTTACTSCPVRSLCAKKSKYKRIELSPHHESVVRQREKRKQPLAREALKMRMHIAETVFALSKVVVQKFTRATVRGHHAARAQWALILTGGNLIKIFRYLQKSATSTAIHPERA